MADTVDKNEYPCHQIILCKGSSLLLICFPIASLLMYVQRGYTNMAVSFRTAPSESQVSVPFVLSLWLLTAIILQHTPVPVEVSYTIVLATYVGISLIFVYDYDAVIESNRFYFMFFITFLIIVGVSTVLNLGTATVVRFISLLVFTSITLFVIPKIIPIQDFLSAASRLTAVLVLIGFLPYLGISIQNNIIDISLWGANIYWYPKLSPITSIFVNPNALGFLTLVGAIAAFTELRNDINRITVFLFIGNSIGLLFTNYRTGWVAFIIALGVFLIYSIGGQELLMTVTLLGLSLLFIVFLMMFAVVPGPTVLTDLSLNNRRIRWIGSYHAFWERFWWGYGLGNVTEAIQPYTIEQTGDVHNSFFRMFVALGISGGIVYLLFYLSTLLESIRHCTEYSDVSLPTLLIVFLFVQLFNDLTFVGISLFSVVIALIIGYVITGD